MKRVPSGSAPPSTAKAPDWLNSVFVLAHRPAQKSTFLTLGNTRNQICQCFHLPDLRADLDGRSETPPDGNTAWRSPVFDSLAANGLPHL